MRRMLFPVLLLLGLAGHAQQGGPRTLNTLFHQPGDTVTGGFFALTGQDIPLLGQDGFLLGARAGVTIGHRWSLGLAGFGLCDPVVNDAYVHYRTDHGLSLPDGLGFRLGYGGIFVERAIMDRSVVHLTIPVTFGAGGASYGYVAEGSRYHRISRTDALAFFFVEPAVELEVNVLQNLRMGIGAAYLFTSPLNLPATASDLLDQPMLRISLKAGLF